MTAGMLRVVTLNLWGEQGPLAARFPLVTSGLVALAPDVVLLQEVRQVAGRVPNQGETLAAALAMHAAFAVATEWGDGQEGLSILSRHPLTDVHHVELPHAVPNERRIVLGATANTDDGPVGLFTSHFNYRLTDGQKREEQIVAAEAIVARHPAPVKIWGGDFNASPDADEIRWLRGARSVTVNGAAKRVYYQDAYALHHEVQPGHTWASRNTHTGALAWLEPNRRIDYLWVSHRNRDGSGAIHSAEIALDEATDGIFPSDHFAVVATVKIARD